MADYRTEIILAAKDITGTAFDRVQGRITGLTKSLFSMKGILTSLTAGAGIGGVGYVIEKTLGDADRIAKIADKVGITTDALQEYRFGADLAGVSTETLDMAMQRYVRRLGEAVQGKGELINVLKQYGIAITDSAGKTRSAEAVLNDLADVIAAVPDKQERLRIAFKAFDSEGAALVNMLRGGSAGLIGFKNEAHALGLVIDQDLLRNAEKAKDGLTKMQRVISTQLTSAVVTLAPEITAVTQGMTDWVKANRDLIDQKTHQAVNLTEKALAKIWTLINYDPAILEFGLLGLAIGGKKGAVILGGMVHLYKWAENLGTAMNMASKGLVSWGEIAQANFTELEQIVDRNREKLSEVLKLGAGLDVMGTREIPLTPAHSPVVQMTGQVAKLDETAQKAAISLRTIWTPNKALPNQFGPDAQAAGWRKWQDLENSTWDKFNTEEIKKRSEALLAPPVDMDETRYIAAFKSIQAQAEESFNFMSELSGRTAWAMQGNFSDFFYSISGGFDSLEDIGRQALDSLRRVFADLAGQMLAQKLFGSLIQGGTGTGWMGQAGTWLQGLFAARQTGGPVYPGGTYLVGERGPELLQMGGSGGYISPRAGASMAFNITVNAGGGADPAAAARQGRMMGEAVASTVRDVLANELRPGGMLARRN